MGRWWRRRLRRCRRSEAGDQRSEVGGRPKPPPPGVSMVIWSPGWTVVWTRAGRASASADCELQIADCGLAAGDCKLLTANCELSGTVVAAWRSILFRPNAPGAPPWRP